MTCRPLNARRLLLCASLITGLWAFGGAMALAQAQAPTKPIRLVVPYAPGGGNDALTLDMPHSARRPFNIVVDHDSHEDGSDAAAGDLMSGKIPGSRSFHGDIAGSVVVRKRSMHDIML